MSTDINPEASPASTVPPPPVGPGQTIAGVQIRQSNVVTGKGTAAAWTVELVNFYAPPNAVSVVAALSSFRLEYPDTDHHVKEIKVSIDPIPAGIPAEITGELLMVDKHSSQEFQGYVWIVVFYLGPYWS